MQILLVIDEIAWKKLRYTLKSSTQAKLFWHFPFIYFVSLQIEKKFHSLRTQLALELVQLFFAKVAAFRFCEPASTILTYEE